VAIKLFDVSKELTASIFIVTIGSGGCQKTAGGGLCVGCLGRCEGREDRTVTSSYPSVAAIGHIGHCCMMGYKTSTVNQL